MKRRLTIVISISTVLCLGIIIGAGILIQRAAKGRTYSDTGSIPYRKVGVLLGCAPHLTGARANLFFDRRIEAATRLFVAHKVSYIIVSGDNHVAGYDEPSEMKRALVSAGVPENIIYCDYAGFRTLDSVVRAKEVFGQSSMTIISQEFHNQRAIYIARHRNIDAIGFNARDVNTYHSFKTRIREMFARVRTVLDVMLLDTSPKFLGPTIEIGN
ncbi:MAG: ElyC/SanA/YdcF family protein [bacterium]